MVGIHKTSGNLLVAMSVAAALIVATPAELFAHASDISIRGLGRPLVNNIPDDFSQADTSIRRYKFLANELAIALMPRPMAPAETLGMDGFEFALISSHTPISFDSKYWQGQPGMPIFEGVNGEHKVPKHFWTPTAQIRKGLPLSMEIGVSGSYLVQSEIFMLGAEYKIAWHESYFRWVPSFATRFSFARLFGSSDLDIITGEADALTSLPIGIGGVVSLTPYIGYGALFIHINSQVIDETPHSVSDPVNDQRGGRDGSLYNFPTINWDKNINHRILAGIRLNAAFVEFVFEFDYIIVDGPNDLQTYSLKIGFDV